MHKQRLAVVVAGALGLVSTFLPWIEISFFGMSSSVAGIRVWQGILVALLAIVAVVLALLGDRTKAIDASKVKIVAGAGAVMLILGLLVIFQGMGFLGFGVYLAVIAGLGVLAVPFVIKDSGEFAMPTKESIKDEFNEMKDN